MLRVTTLYASSAATTAGYYTQYLAQAEGEAAGVWSGAQAGRLGLGGEVGAEALQLLLEGRDPVAGTPLGMALVDRYTSTGAVVRAVAGFDATFSAPKSVSVLWALTGDERILAVHDQAVAAALAHLERFGSTTRVRVNGSRMFPVSNGLTMATFRQSTSRADDPQLHTHAVISAKVQLADGRWLALDARYLKRQQRTLGGLYQSALRAGLHAELGVVWGPVVNGQAEIAGMPEELLAVFSKRTGQVEAALADKLVEFRSRQGRDPTTWERAALTREAAVDTRAHKTGTGPDDLSGRWRREANEVGWTTHRVLDDVRRVARDHTPDHTLSLVNVLDRLSAAGSTWYRADVLRAVCDLAPVRSMNPERWAQAVERVVDRVLEACVDLDPEPGRDGSREGCRDTDGRSVWIEPTATQFTSEQILAQEEHVLTWAMDRQSDDPVPSGSVEVAELDVAQADAACSVAGRDRLVIVEGPAGTGKTTMLRTAVDALTAEDRPVLGLAPTAKAARVLGTETGMAADTIAKLLHEHARTDRPATERYRPPAGATIIVDEAGMIGTPTLHQLTQLADRHDWRVVLVGDPRQLQAVGRGGMFAELRATGRVHELATIHRFTNQWEAAASLKLRHGDPTVFDTYEDHHRITSGVLDRHLEHLAHAWTRENAQGRTVAITATSNAHVDAINHSVQARRLVGGDLDAQTRRPIAGDEHAHVGDVVVTRRNDRTLTSSHGEPVRNRDVWTVAAAHPDGTLTVTPHRGHGSVRLPADYVRQHVRLGYAATEHGNQGVTTDTAYHLVTEATTARGLYVGATRGRDRNQLLVVTTDDRDARQILERVLTSDRADIPAHVQRRTLHAAIPTPPAPRERRTQIPDPAWLTGWRDALVGEREEILTDHRNRETDRQQALIELRAVQPELRAARQAWQPYQAQIDTLERQLRDELRPAMWTANAQARDASFGHRRGASRRAEQATSTVHEAENAITAIREDAHVVKDHLDRVQQIANRLERRASPDDYADLWENHQLERANRLIDAIDTWTRWNTGQPMRPADLAHALDVLDHERGVAPGYLTAPSQPTSRQVGELVQPLGTWLTERGIQPQAQAQSVDRRADHGIDL